MQEKPNISKETVLSVVVGILVLISIGIVFIAYLIWGLGCSENCTARSWQLKAEFVVAWVIVAVALAMACCAICGLWKAALVLIVTTLALYAGWVLLLVSDGARDPHAAVLPVSPLPTTLPWKDMGDGTVA